MWQKALQTCLELGVPDNQRREDPSEKVYGYQNKGRSKEHFFAPKDSLFKKTHVLWPFMLNTSYVCEPAIDTV